MDSTGNLAKVHRSGVNLQKWGFHGRGLFRPQAARVRRGWGMGKSKNIIGRKYKLRTDPEYFKYLYGYVPGWARGEIKGRKYGIKSGK